MVELLLQHGAEVSDKDMMETAAWRAREIVRLLGQHEILDDTGGGFDE